MSDNGFPLTVIMVMKFNLTKNEYKQYEDDRNVIK